MKTLATILIMAATCSASTPATDFGHDVKKGMDARKEFVQRVNGSDMQDTNMKVRAAGFLDDTLEFENTSWDPADTDYLLAKTLNSREAEDQNFRTILRTLGFRYIQVGNRRVELPNTETLNPPSGTREYNFSNVG